MVSVIISNHLLAINNKLELYRVEDASEEFVRRLEKDCIRRREIMVKTYKPMSLTKGEKKEFRKNSICHIW